MEFLVPLHTADLELTKADRYYVHHVQTFEDEANDEIRTRLQKLEDHVLGSDAGLELLEEECLDLTYSLVKKLPSLSEGNQLRVVQMLSLFVKNITEGVTTLEIGSDKEESQQYRSAFKASVYFLITALTTVSHLQLKAEKDILKKGKKTQNVNTINRIHWSKVVETSTLTLSKSICPETFALWKMNLPEEEFAILYSKFVFQLLENASLCRGKTVKPKLYMLLAQSLQKAPAIHISVVTSLIDLIYTHEHLSGPIAELLEMLYSTYSNIAFASDLISEIGKISYRDSSKDVSGTKNISTFLSTLSTRTPSLIVGNLSFVLALLDAESYQLRNAAVTCITQILLWNFRQKGTQAQHDSAENSHDTQSTRSKRQKRQKRRKADRDHVEDGDNENEYSEDDEEEDDDFDDSDLQDLDEVERTRRQGGIDDDSQRTFSRSTRDQLLSVLEDRIQDVNSFSRGHVLKMWALLCEEGALPVHMLKTVTLLAVSRLQDKAAVVRRHSIHFLTLLLERNPFMGNLDRASYETKREELAAQLKKKREEMIQNAENDIREAMAPSSSFSAEEHAQMLEQELQTMERMLRFYTDAIDFIEEFELRALPLMGQLLGSKSVSDVLEAIQFFEKAYRFHLEAAQVGIKKMLPLIWRADTTIHEQLMKTFVSLFVTIDVQDTERNSPQAIAENLVKFYDQCSVAEYTCLEKIIGELHRQRMIPMAVISALWSFVDEAYPVSVLGNAMSLLSMIAIVDDSILFSNDRLDQVLANGFGDVACKTDTSFRVLGAACRLVQCIQTNPKASDSTKRRRRIQRTNLDTTEQIVFRLQRVLALDFVGVDDSEALRSNAAWFDSVQQAIEAVFCICERPEDVIGDVVKHLSLRLFQNENESVSPFELAHFLFILGHSAVKVAVHVEKLATKIKKLRANQDGLKKAPSTESRTAPAPDDVTAMEDELGVAAEVEAEEDTFVQNMIRKEIACRNLLGVYGPLIIRVLVSEGDEFKGDELLTECAVVALSKFMAVSEEFCEKHLQLLFTILQESPLPAVRSDVIVALGDLSFRFPNLIEPWTAHLYNRLRDVDLNVRKNTIVVLSHLILNDMIKVKGQISDIAISLVDKDEGIRNSAKLFFNELSKKGNNPIYNMLPDAIGQLSSSELVSTGDFETITKFLLDFLTKDKHVESIVEKLSYRFPSAAKTQQQRDLSFCLSRLSHTEKSLRYLYQNRKLISDALHDSVVVENFTQLVNRCRRGHQMTTTAEMKEAIDQLERFIIAKKDGQEEEAPEGGSKELSPSQTKSKRKGKKGKSMQNVGGDAKANKRTKPKRQAANKARRKIVDSDSEE